MTAQLGHWRAAIAAGQGRVGWKIGFNDPAARDKLGLPSALLGYLTDRTVVECGQAFAPAPDATILLEGELGVQVAREVPPGGTLEEARAAIAACAAAIELVDMSAGLGDFEAVLAGNIFHRAVAFGPTRAGLPWQRSAEVRMDAWVDGEPVCSGDPESRLPTDFGALVRLAADQLGEHGEGLRPGDWIISGSIIQPLALRPGQAARVAIAGLEPVSVRLA